MVGNAALLGCVGRGGGVYRGCDFRVSGVLMRTAQASLRPGRPHVTLSPRGVTRGPARWKEGCQGGPGAPSEFCLLY